MNESEVLIVDKRITFALALRGQTLEMLEELQETLKCCNHAQALEKAIRIAWEATRIPGNATTTYPDSGSWFEEFVGPRL